MPVRFRRHVVGKTLRSVCHRDSTWSLRLTLTVRFLTTHSNAYFVRYMGCFKIGPTVRSLRARQTG